MFFHINVGGGAGNMKGLAALTGAGRLHASKDGIMHGQMAGKDKSPGPDISVGYLLAV